MPLLSVITVVKDDLGGFTRTLASLAEADLTDVELVVLDGSKDRGAIPAVLSDVAQLDARYAWETPSGVYPAMNTALSTSSGQYVYFLNAGDTLVCGAMLPSILQVLREQQPLWALGEVRFEWPNGSVVSEPAWEYAVERRHLFARGRFPPHQGVIMDRSALVGLGGFDTSFRVAADYAVILAFSRMSDPLPLHVTLAAFTIGGLSTDQWRTAQREFHRARREVFQPRGRASLAEFSATFVGLVSTHLYRALWAPGQPAHALVRRLRGGAPRSHE